MPMQSPSTVIAIDWSGRVDAAGQRRHISAATWQAGKVRVESGRTREEVGDWLIENDQVRFVIADKGVGRVNTTFGGTLVDADLQRVGSQSTASGNDEMAELLPGFVFTVIDPTDVCVPTLEGACPTSPDQPLADGSDGRPAEILVTGIGGDLFEMVALLNTGLVGPSATLAGIIANSGGAQHVKA